MDAIVLTDDPAVVRGLRALLEADRENRPPPEDLPDRLIVGPEDARRKYEGLIEGARSRIHLIDPKADDPALIALLKARREAGIDVIVFDQKELAGLRSHGKIMLVDDAVAVVGGLSLNALGLDFRREVAIVVDEPAAVAEIRGLFEQVAAPSAPPDEAGPAAQGDTPC